MDIIYLSSSCSDKKFNELREKGITRKLPQAQKYHNLLMEGLASCIDGKLVSISAFPVNRQWTKQIKFKREEEVYGNIHYVYDSFINMNVLRQITRQKRAQKEIKRLYRENKDCAIVCDVLNQSIAKAARKMGKKYKIPVIGIVTDVPGYMSGARRKTLSFVNRMISKFGEKRAQANVSKYDAYLLLTEQMNAVVNAKNKPYIVIEGHCDSKMATRPNIIDNKTSPKIIMYAGGVHREFGIRRMVDAFLKANIQGWQLHIYGDGNCEKELTALSNEKENIKYFGTKPNSVIVEKQLEATLLVNPRLTDAEYVKYSFPSKTMECMVSGTPLLTTKLPGMPKEYHQYVYLFEDESEDGMCETFKSVLDKTALEYHEKGNTAKQFVLQNKSNVIQAQKLLDFISKLMKKG
ncbi:MAG: glycosyltransferase [Clostridiales bacterium]|nr:glycosyltransferase [Clostridiales bacterium]